MYDTLQQKSAPPKKLKTVATPAPSASLPNEVRRAAPIAVDGALLRQRPCGVAIDTLVDFIN